MKTSHAGQHGFSLLETLVAFAIMALALGVLYRATGGAVRDVTHVETRQRALSLLQSVLAGVDGVPERGLAEQGESQALRWSVRAAPFASGVTGPDVPPLHEVQATVVWDEGGLERQMQLSTLRPQLGAITPRAQP